MISYFNWSNLVFSGESHHEQSHHSDTVDDGNGEAKEINECAKVARYNHQYRDKALSKFT